MLVVVRGVNDVGSAVAKHDTHGFEMDKPGKDSWRLREAGADLPAKYVRN